MINNKLVLLRHGESLWNSENRFTGWTDVDLTKNGENEAKKAGSLLNNNIQIDLVYISYLKRAVRTFKICQKQLKKTNIEVIYDWRLNERHYGSLQGLNKSQTAQKYGEEQVLIWRRSFDTRPPPLDQDDKRHPKYDNLYKDIDHKKLPNSESLKDTLKRVKPLWDNNIAPQIKNGKNILIVAHGNSLRAFVKILKKISNKDIVGLNIPTGIPYIFEINNNLDVKKDYYLGN
tara:strand:- start:437 stop:1132 length:696 start_codon:yes stop_codon:yes gene_type:complete